MFITTANAMYTLGHGLRTLPAVPRSTQPSTLRGTVKWVSFFWQSNNNKWERWMWMAAAIYRQTHSPSRLAWSEVWLPPGAQSAFIKWTGWTLAVTVVMRTAPQTIACVLSLLALAGRWAPINTKIKPSVVATTTILMTIFSGDSKFSVHLSVLPALVPEENLSWWVTQFFTGHVPFHSQRTV